MIDGQRRNHLPPLAARDQKQILDRLPSNALAYCFDVWLWQDSSKTGQDGCGLKVPISVLRQGLSPLYMSVYKSQQKLPMFDEKRKNPENFF